MRNVLPTAKQVVGRAERIVLSERDSAQVRIREPITLWFERIYVRRLKDTNEFVSWG
jgi:hypothetical protein